MTNSTKNVNELVRKVRDEISELTREYLSEEGYRLEFAGGAWCLIDEGANEQIAYSVSIEPVALYALTGNHSEGLHVQRLDEGGKYRVVFEGVADPQGDLKVGNDGDGGIYLNSAEELRFALSIERLN